jgi:hypothetical protein
MKEAQAALRLSATTPSTTPITSDSFMMMRSSPSDLDLCAGPLPEQDAIASLHVERHELAALIASTRPGGDDLSFLRLLLRGIWNDDATLGLLFGIDTADHDAVVQGAKFHRDFLRHAPVPASLYVILALVL